MIKNGRLINSEVRIENTSRCNAHCVICPREKMTRAKTTMCWGVFCSLVMQSVELGADTISVFGYGEPMLDKELEKKIQYCSDNKLNTWITTNASVLGMQRSFDLIDAGLKNIRFSFHAVTPHDYDKVHKGLSWIETVRNIANFLHINNRAGNPVATHLTAIPLNNEPTEQVIELWGERVDYLEIWRPHNWGGKKDYRDSYPRKKSCGRPFTGPVQIQADGDVIPCCFLTDGEIVLGNIHDEPIVDILTNRRYEELRQMHRDGYYKNVPCGMCDQRNIEVESPLLYSSRDESKKIGTTSTTKFILENQNDLFRKADKYNADSCGTGSFINSPCSP